VPGTRDLLEARNTRYADAWSKTGDMAKSVTAEIAHMHFHHPALWYPWVIILNKLARILGDPNNIDSWQDIAGYATLVVDSLEKKKGTK